MTGDASAPQRVPVRKRSRLAAVGAVGASAAALLVGSPEAAAYNLLNCQWSTNTVWYGVSAGTTSAAQSGALLWDSTNQLRFRRNDTPGAHVFRARSPNEGPVNYSGVYRRIGTVDGYPSCTNGIWVSGHNEVIGNSYYLNLPQYTSSWDKGLFAHEFGHAAGLDHNNATYGCPAGGAAYDAIMHFSDARFSGNCPRFTPTVDDRNGADAMYK